MAGDMFSLDVGCGHRENHDKKRGMIGIDRMRGKCDVLADAHFLPFKHDVFETIFLYAILEHLVNPNKCMEEARRVSKANARIYISIPQITSMVKWNLRKSVTDFPFGLLVSFRWLIRRKRTPRYSKELGHKSIIKPRCISNHFRVTHIQKCGSHAWFHGKKGIVLRKLGLKDRTKLDTWFIIAKNVHS